MLSRVAFRSIHTGENPYSVPVLQEELLLSLRRQHWSPHLMYWFKHILFRKISMYNIYCDNINTLGYERKQNAYIVLLLYIRSCKHTAAKDLLTMS